MAVKKRGVSPVVAVVFLILLVLVIASLIFGWARGFVSDKSEESKAEYSGGELCEAVDVHAVIAGRDGNNFDFEIVNRGNIDVKYLAFEVSIRGKTQVIEGNNEIPAGGAVVESIFLDGFSVTDGKVFPVLDSQLIGGSSDFVCSGDPFYVES